jgi:hypothetical protein
LDLYFAEGNGKDFGMVIPRVLIIMFSY